MRILVILLIVLLVFLGLYLTSFQVVKQAEAKFPPTAIAPCSCSID
jgi:hypothetical protein